MKLTLRQEWRRPLPLSSFLGFLDLKTGVTIALLFAVLNKVAGVYGLIAMLTGAGSSAAQLTLYIYSVLALVGLAWGLKAVQEEDPRRTLYFAHGFFADHILSTAWTVFFIVDWWVYTAHDGQRIANSPAQAALIDAYLGTPPTYTDAERTAAAERIWNSEKGQALAIIIGGWLVKFYFAALLYSYASHLRRNTYRALPLSRANAAPASYAPLAPDADDLDDDPTTPVLPLHANGHAHAQWATHKPAGSGAFADFVAAPPPRRASRLGAESASAGEEDAGEEADSASTSAGSAGEGGNGNGNGLGTARVASGSSSGSVSRRG